MAEKFTKVALDEAAKAYWKLLWGEYGEALVRDVPRRIKAALVDNKKVAMSVEAATVLPVAHAITAEGLQVEGLYRDGKQKLMFHATLDKNLDVTEVKSFELR